VIELAARLGGGHDAELCEAALGVDLNGLAIDAAFGRKAGVRHLRSLIPAGGACVVFLVAPPGILRSVEGLDEAGALPGIRWVRSYRPPGWQFGPLRRGADRAGAVLAVGNDRNDALSRAHSAAGLVRFVVDAEPV
jgi:biotin carboxylase